MLQPRRQKYRKQMKSVRHIRGVETRGVDFAFGEYALQAQENGWLTARQIEAGRVAGTRTAKRGGKFFIRVFPDKPLTKKPAETRMGKGKGSPELFVAEVRAGRIIYEITGVTPALAKEALERAASKMPIKCSIITRSENLL